MRLVLDTDVVVAAMRSPSGGSAKLLTLIDDGQATMLLSVALALEYEALCYRPEHRRAAGLSRGEVGIFVTGLISLAEPVKFHFRWRPQLRDAGDEMVLDTAINGQADAIVTFNHKDYTDVPKKFGIAALKPGDALRRILI